MSGTSGLGLFDADKHQLLLVRLGKSSLQHWGFCVASSTFLHYTRCQENETRLAVVVVGLLVVPLSIESFSGLRSGLFSRLPLRLTCVRAELDGTKLIQRSRFFLMFKLVNSRACLFDLWNIRLGNSQCSTLQHADYPNLELAHSKVFRKTDLTSMVFNYNHTKRVLKLY